MYDAYDFYDRNERANERETDDIRNAVWEEHIRRHEDGTTHVPNTITSLCDTVEELRAELEQMREGIRRERADAEISWNTAEIYMDERDKALLELEQVRYLLRETEDREVRYIQTINKIRTQMQSAYAQIAADVAARSPELVHAVTIDIDRLPANLAA